ncbi:hypothetical protein D3C81_2119480 [compost metagenome]
MSVFPVVFGRLLDDLVIITPGFKSCCVFEYDTIFTGSNSTKLNVICKFAWPSLYVASKLSNHMVCENSDSKLITTGLAFHSSISFHACSGDW